MARLRTRYPDADVDLLAHSQGGVVARTYLAEQASAWDPTLPRVAHLVTFAAPHQGARIASEVDEIRDGALPKPSNSCDRGPIC
jgi:triacylglycerol esterase/lipase EstA (alpha/beta hydrolase family)